MQTNLTVDIFLKSTNTFSQFYDVFWLRDPTTLRYMLHLAHTLYINCQYPVYALDVANLVEICAKGGIPQVDHDKVEAIAKICNHLFLPKNFDKTKWTEVADYVKPDRGTWRQQ